MINKCSHLSWSLNKRWFTRGNCASRQSSHNKSLVELCFSFFTFNSIEKRETNLRDNLLVSQSILKLEILNRRQTYLTRRYYCSISSFWLLCIHTSFLIICLTFIIFNKSLHSICLLINNWKNYLLLCNQNSNVWLKLLFSLIVNTE
jgi:hypothetical protein